MDQQALEQLQQQQMAMQGAAGMGAGVAIVYLAVLVFMIAVYWKIFAKAGQPGWASLVPIYNLIVFLKIVGRPVWWIVLMLIPLVNFIVLIILSFDLAKVFGKSAGFGIGLILLGIVFAPILAFGSAQYKGPAAGGVPAPAAA